MVRLQAPAFALLALAIVQPPRLRAPDVKYVATPQNVVEAMLELAHVTAADVVYDLGSGDGRIPITAAAKYGARGVGIEIDPAMIRVARDNLAKAGVADRVTLLNQDLFETDIRGATVVTLFLLPHLNVKLIPKLKSELRPGARVVSFEFHMGDEWPPDRVEDLGGVSIYLWTMRNLPTGSQAGTSNVAWTGGKTFALALACLPRSPALRPSRR